VHADRPPLDVASLRDTVTGPGKLWRELDVVLETGSTNADLIARAAQGRDIGGSVLIAEHQTAGRGRNGRQWSTAPRAQVTLSVGVTAEGVPSEAWGWLPLAAGVAVVDTVAAVSAVKAGLKWPNDVLAGEGGSPRKLAGILAEVAAPSPVIVVGMGLNVTLRADEIGDPVATSLLDLGAASTDRDRLVRRLLDELGRRVAGWREAGGGGAGLAADYAARSLTIGARVRAVLPGDREVVGTARDIDHQGRLRIDTDEGLVTVSAGDVIHLRTP
jgi:BirA family biotin operon repressor/biotin-[acetyl-CoA-carboxylase] ligase